MKQLNPKIYIVILNWNGLNDTTECLNSLKSIDYNNYRVILIDNHSDVNEGDKLKSKFGDYIYLIKTDKNYGFAEGNNIGIRFALKNNADDILCLNNDTLVQPDFLSIMVEALKESQDIGMVACKILNFPDKKTINATWSSVHKTGLFVGNGYGEIDTKLYDNTEFVFGPSGCCALFSASMLKEIAVNNDFFDKELFAYHEDIDIAFRAQWKGWKCIYCPQAIIYHRQSKSLGNNSAQKLFLTNKNNLNVLVKNYPAKVIFKYLPFLLARQFALIFYYFRQSPSAILKSQFFAVKEFSNYFSKRKQVLKSRKVSSDYINSILN
ncbi:MAG: glycosyltransferase family 2 protein [Patescibacteria group bacterium]|nr:glycosyltransferase family 2 protein [Patescibacteria group bacterium]